MTMKVHILLTICISAIFVSCSNDELLTNKFESAELTGVCVLQERDPKLPTEPLEYPIETEEAYSRSNGSTVGKLGYSYFVGNSLIGNPENIGGKVLDINKIKDFDSELVDSTWINNYVSDRFAYTDYETYESHLFETKKITTGFKINLGLFSLGRKSTNLSTFSSDITSSQTVVYGELNMMYRYKSYTLKARDVERKYFARDCQTNSFKRNLYGSSIGKLIEAYGPFVLAGYVTGGKAVALFAGEGKTYDGKEKRTSAMNRAIDVSFQWPDKNNSNKKDSVGGNASFGKTDSVMNGNTYDIKNLKTKLWIAGGTPIGATLNSTIDLAKVNIDLVPWVQSLSDPSKHSIIDVTNDGLYPLSEFVLEENFKKRIDNTAMGITSANNKIIVPYIEITRVFNRYSTSGVALYDVAAVLVTRQGDRIILRTGDISSNSDYELSRNENSSVFSAKAEDIKNNIGNIFKLKIESNSVSRLNPLIGNPLCIDLKKINLESMQRRPQASSGIVYIYDPDNKIAFSYYDDIVNGDIVLDQYGIRDWAETIPQKSISIASIANLYRIIGL